MPKPRCLVAPLLVPRRLGLAACGIGYTMAGDPGTKGLEMGAVWGRVVVGAAAGAVIGVVSIAALTATGVIRHDLEDGTEWIVAGVAVGGSAGGALAAFAGTREVRGLARDVAWGVVAGCVLGLLAAAVSASVAAGQVGAMRQKVEAGYRLRAMLIGAPAGSLLGGLCGGVAWAVRRREAHPPPSWRQGRP